MSKNNLFFFLKHFGNTPQFGPTRCMVNAKKTIENKNYFFCDLPLSQPIFFKDTSKAQTYQLKSHHISIFELVDHENPCLSAYHYTAIVADQNNQEQTLHVFFNGQDSLTIDAQFTDKSMSKDLKESFEEFAINTVRPYITEIKQLRLSAIRKLTHDYHQEQRQLYSLSQANQVASLPNPIAVDKIINILSILKKIDSNNRYQGLCGFYKKMKSITREAAPSLPPVQPEVETNTDTTIAFFKAHPIKIKRAVEVPIEDEIAKIQPLLARYHETPDQDIVEKAMRFHELLLIINEVNILIVDTNCIVTISELSKFQEVLLIIETDGPALFHQLLKNKLFKQAELLIQFLKDKQNSLFDEALYAGDSELLRFILSHASIDLNAYELNAVLPAYYCVETLANKDVEKAIACLRVLIEFNASILIPNSKGLPLAYEILQNTQHPLRPLLGQVANKTISNKPFIHKLISKLNRLLDNNCCDDRESVSQFVQGYTSRFEKSESSPTRNRALGKMEQALEPLKSAESERVMADPEVIYARETLFRKKEEFLTKLSREDRRKVDLYESKRINEIIKTIEQFFSSDFGDKSFDEIKKYTLKHYETASQIIDNSIEIIMLKNQLKVPRSQSGKLSKGQKKDIEQLKKLTAANLKLEEYLMPGLDTRYNDLVVGIEGLKNTCGNLMEMMQLLRTSIPALAAHSIFQEYDTSPSSQDQGDELNSTI